MAQRKITIDFSVWTTVIKKAAQLKITRQGVWNRIRRGELETFYISEIDVTLVKI